MTAGSRWLRRPRLVASLPQGGATVGLGDAERASGNLEQRLGGKRPEDQKSYRKRTNQGLSCSITGFAARRDPGMRVY